MASSPSYFAYGRLAEHEGYQFLVKPSGEIADQDLLFRLAASFKEGGDAPPAGPRIPGLAEGIDLRSAAVVCLRRPSGSSALLLNRLQRQLTRGGMLLEGILLEAAPPAENRTAVLKLLRTLSEEPSVDGVRQTEREFAQRAATAASLQPLRQILAVGNPEIEACRRLLARALAAFVRREAGRPVAVVLPARQAHLVMPVALGLDEMLPPAEREQGFAVSMSLVAGIDSGLWGRVDWIVCAAEAGVRLFQAAEAVAACDLRSEASAQDAVASGIEKLLGQGSAAAEAFAEWLAVPAKVKMADLGPDFWKRLSLRLALGDRMEVPPGELLAEMGPEAWRCLDFQSFQKMWNVMMRRPSDTAGPRQMMELLAKGLDDCPPLVGWLVHPSVLRPELSSTIMQVCEKAFTATSAAEGN